MRGRLNENVKRFPSIEPDAYGTGTVTGDVINCQGLDEVEHEVDIGEIASTGVLDFKIQESADGSTGWADIDGAAITQKTEAGGDGDETCLISVQMTADRLLYQRASLTLTTAGADVGASARGLARDLPVTQPATVTEVVEV